MVPEAREALQRGTPASGSGAPDRGLLWVVDKHQVRPLTVQSGLSDGITTEILGGELREGDAVVIGEIRKEEGEGEASPFAPRLFGGRR
jgi:HlyD family secretion protein